MTMSIKKILVVEDSDMVSKVLRHILQHSLPHQIEFAASLAETKALCEAANPPFFAALADLNLPDAPNGEVVDFLLRQKIPTIVLTSSYDERRREALFDKGIVDYVTKEGRYAYGKAVSMISRLEKNQQIKVLVVDDSDMSRKHLANLLRRHLFQVLEAVDGVDAIKVLLENPDIKLLVTDYNMPRMDGFELVKNLRYKYDKTDLIMIGLSGESSEALSAKFIKQGANDFLRKPFYPEEFYCRIIHNIESLEQIERITYLAQRDQLTGLYHRHYFFNIAQDIYRNAQEKSLPLTAVAINIDGFRQINQAYGNAWGDMALQHFAQRLNEMLDRFLLARADGDQFYVLLPGLDNNKAVALIARVRQLVAAEPMLINDTAYYFSFSAGVTARLGSSLDEFIAHAVSLLNHAREAGGNITVDDQDD
jgi:diguanylate cyclase (GGDEF)-like protein